MSEQDMQRLLDLLERQLGKQWIDISDWLRAQASLPDLEQMLRTGDISALTAAIQDAAKTFAAAETQAFGLAGQRAAAWLNGQTDALIHYDAVNTGAVRWAQANTLETVGGLGEEQRQTINQVLTRGARAGTNPRVMARDIREGLGLTPAQEGWVSSYRAALESGNYSNALGRELGHGWSDSAIGAAQRAGRSLTQDQIDTAVDRYRGNVVTYRAENIARTEALRVAHQGTDEALQQAVARGDVDANELVSQWNPGPRTKDARPEHRTAELLAQRPKLGELFLLADGTQMSGPGDPRGGAKHTCSCRCVKSTRYRPAVASAA